MGAIKEGVNCQFMHTKLIDITTIGERVFFCKIVVFKNVFRKHYQPVLWGFCEWENGTFYNFFFFKSCQLEESSERSGMNLDSVNR